MDYNYNKFIIINYIISYEVDNRVIIRVLNCVRLLRKCKKFSRLNFIDYLLICMWHIFKSMNLWLNCAFNC